MSLVYEAEQAKYRRVWAESELYHRCSPGLRHAPEALDWYAALGAGSLIDFGCGDGRAIDWFREHDVPAFGIDLVTHDRPDIIEGTLWDMPSDLVADFGYCCDVLEHLPTAFVDDALAGLARACRLGAWFQIALFHDTAGTQLSPEMTLHLTVKPWTWWVDRINRHFVIAESGERHGRAWFELTKENVANG